jgi:hypothetical protein
MRIGHYAFERRNLGLVLLKEGQPLDRNEFASRFSHWNQKQNPDE